jgi:hypothetical protein
MARTALTPQNIAVAGLAPSFSAGDAANGHEFANDGATFLEVKNAGGSPITVTLLTPYTYQGVAITDPTVSVPATTGDRMIGPFPTTVFNTAGGLMQFDLSGATSVTVAVFRVPGV